MRIAALLACALLAAAGCKEKPKPVPAESAEQDKWEGFGSQTVVLFFAEGSARTTWREESRAIEMQADLVDRVARAVEELLRGPTAGKGRAFPPGSRLLHAFLEESEGALTLDFDPAVAQALTQAGSVEERVALDSLRRTLRVNFPALRSLRILIGGEMRDSLAGHLSIARPIPLDAGD
jgi:spore germination protein GerM